MPSFKLNQDHIMEAVYSYPFPEVRELIDSTKLSAAFMLNTLQVEKASDYLKSYAFNPELALPHSIDGSLNLDELHVPITKRIHAQLEPMLPGLDGFECAYPTPGSSQAMFTLMAEWKAKGEFTTIAVLEGEYEGYSAYAQSLNIPISTYKSLDDLIPKKSELWFISNPSAIDGNLISKEKWHKFTHAGHKIVYDAAYLGLTENGYVDVSSPNIRAVLTSPSKVFGVFRYRNTGLCFTRTAVSALYGTKWFKDIPALLDTLQLYETFPAHELPKKYRDTQAFICAELSRVVGCDVVPSDTLLLGFTAGPVAPAFEKFKRADVYRFGLTKLFEDYEARFLGSLH